MLKWVGNSHIPMPAVRLFHHMLGMISSEYADEPYIAKN